MADLAFNNLCGPIAASFPALSTDQIKSWTARIMGKMPPEAALTQTANYAA
jgi:hypothetical protein